MIDPTWKDGLQTEPLLGCFVTFASPANCEFTAEIGFDFTLIDNEHGLMHDETLENMVRASQAADCPSIVRTPFNQPDYIRRALDFGANGIQVPLVNDVADAHKVVKASHFPPFGERGVAFQTRPARYGMVSDKAAYLRDADRAKLVAVHVETVEAVDRLDALLEVEGIDVYFVGRKRLGKSPLTQREGRCRLGRDTGEVMGEATGGLAAAVGFLLEEPADHCAERGWHRRYELRERGRLARQNVSPVPTR
ncbi:HpcH/HpaI aldolase family protein [Pseudonocardia charpentierae]|uniref:Aldolase/citrate lyase family protein n=1 Tax=Pseudonocardia charpentierae TaxID=3075545 RepID=A0ABU2NGH5_9PSEU|nr:aldolase/citrate lyase family protein [Pseudonocardia sp. DSM 45834]MDT0352846.1 aldolase/citrate lyase family protein [Pseudonocardia sp. DSM 45834]